MVFSPRNDRVARPYHGRALATCSPAPADLLPDAHDLTAIRKTAETRIAAAKNDAEAKEAIDWFVRQFGDGHALVQLPGDECPEVTQHAQENPRPWQ